MLEQLIRRTRRRLLIQESLRQIAIASSVAIAGLALLLIVGTRYLEWWALTLLTVAAGGYALAKILKAAPDSYTTAVRLDEEAGLHDALSTAHYFSRHRESEQGESQPPAVILAQRELAENLAGTLNIKTTLPFRVPKALYALAILLFASTGLVTLRYFVGGKLDLRRPLTEVLFEDLAAKSPVPKAATPGHRKDIDEARSLLERLGLDPRLPENPNNNLEDALAKALEASKPTDGMDSRPGENQGGEKTPSGDKSKNGESPAKDPQKDAENNQKSAGDPMASDKPAGGKSGGEKSGQSLLSRLKEAMDNIVGAPQADNDLPPKSESKQDQKSQQAKAGARAGMDKGEAAPAEGKGEGEAQAAKAEGKSSGAGDPKEGPSAAGAEEGQKAIKLAQQLKAMGKLSEIIGKRAGQVKGETMVEVSSGDQKLHSAYTGKDAAHGEGKGEVSRDAIPLASQSYVQQYFERVRKSGGSKN